MTRRVLFVLGSIASALLAIELSPPPGYVVETFSPHPETSRAASIRPAWPGTFARKLRPGATWSPSWRPYYAPVHGK